MYGSQYARDTRDTGGKSPRRLSILGVTGIFAALVTPVTPDDPDRPNTHHVARSTSAAGLAVDVGIYGSYANKRDYECT
jgi:hypothetical protein